MFVVSQLPLLAFLMSIPDEKVTGGVLEQSAPCLRAKAAAAGLEKSPVTTEGTSARALSFAQQGKMALKHRLKE
jgi:hypothetical protein